MSDTRNPMLDWGEGIALVAIVGVCVIAAIDCVQPWERESGMEAPAERESVAEPVAAEQMVAAALPPEPTPVVRPPRPTCDEIGAERSRYTEAERADTARRIWRTCERLGNSIKMCILWDIRQSVESSGNPSVVHTSGRGELGYGPFGLSEKHQGGKYPGRPDREFCTPEVSGVVMHEIMWRAAVAYQASTVKDFQAVFGGHTHKGDDGKWRANSSWGNLGGLCRSFRNHPLAKKRGITCRSDMGKRDLGPRLKYGDRKAFVDESRAENDANRDAVALLQH